MTDHTDQTDLTRPGAELPIRSLGDGLSVSALGLGCMGMSYAYGTADRSESIATVHRALDRGVTLLDTANVYGAGHNEELLGEALTSRRDEAQIATKFGIVPTSGSAYGSTVDATPEAVRRNIDESLHRLRTDRVELFYLHRPDTTVPIEETVGAMAELVEAGKVIHLGLSEASADTVRRAAAVHPIAALQSEWSLFSRDIEAEVLPACRALGIGIGIVPYSPLGRGMLTGAAAAIDGLADDDFRRTLPRWRGENLDANRRLVAEIVAIADGHGVAASQVALAWLLAQGDDVVPIPGTKRRRYLDENLDALDVQLSGDELDALSALRPAGDRYGDMSWAERSTPVAN